MPLHCWADDKSLENCCILIPTGKNVQRAINNFSLFFFLILFIYLHLWIIVSVNQRQLDKGFHAAENSYAATLEGDCWDDYIYHLP